MKIINCMVNHLHQPLGYQMQRTVFSWQVIEAKGSCQKTARIQVALDPCMERVITDTGFCADLDSIASPVEIALQPRTRYYWTVAVCSDAGETAVSEVNWFETAKQGEKWSASWITCASQARHPIFEKKILLHGSVASARLYICGLGVYEASLGDCRIGEEYLTPYCNNYEAWVQYQTYDVTALLTGDTMLSVLIGHGWYSGRMGYA